MKKILVLILSIATFSSFAQDNNYQIALLQYNGGGDWYANLETSLPNLIEFTNKNLGTNINAEQAIVEVGSPEVFNYPLLHLTGHGNVLFSLDEANNLRKYLESGGFLHIDDNYGMDKFIRPQMKKVFPELDFVELPFTHPIYHQQYDFANGLPKVHKHDEKPPQGFGLIFKGRLVCFYSYESDLGDGWEDFEIHKDSDATRLKALKMGANILQYAFTQNAG
ncbi:MAG TPA: DUF4159 domain-containing protein [Flavobacteriales bacterium]|nr:DUF4159 domain-containing protein [Flavobacteriales bacterium]